MFGKLLVDSSLPPQNEQHVLLALLAASRGGFDERPALRVAGGSLRQGRQLSPRNVPCAALWFHDQHHGQLYSTQHPRAGHRKHESKLVVVVV